MKFGSFRKKSGNYTFVIKSYKVIVLKGGQNYVLKPLFEVKYQIKGL